MELLELDNDTNSLTPTVTPPPTTTSSKIRSSTPPEFQAPDLGALIMRLKVITSLY